MSPSLLLLLVVTAASAAVVTALVVRGRRTERRFDLQKGFVQELFEGSSDATVLVDRDGRILQANPALGDLFGVKPEDVRGRPLEELCVPDDRRGEAWETRRRILSGDPVEIESVRTRADGSRIDVSIHGTSLGVPGEPVAGFVVFRDITRRLRLESAFRRLEKAVETMQLGVTVTDLDGRILYTNAADAAMHGWEPDELIGRDVRLFAPSGKAKPMSPVEIDRMTRWRRDSVNVRRDGSVFPVHLMSDVVRDAADEPIGIVTTCEDITERQRAERALRESEERYALAIRGANDGLWDWNLATGEVFYSARWKALLGYDEGEVENTPEAWFSRVHPEDLPRLKADLSAHREDRADRFENEHRIRHADGEYRWALARGMAERDPEGTPYRIVGSLTDVTDRKEVEEQLSQDALYDTLTGLPNRAFLGDLLHRAFLRRHRRPEYTFALLFLDLDRFKVVNDSLGHTAGDLLLVEVSRRFLKCVRPGDVVTRLAGDEFCVLLDDIRDASDATRVAERIQEMLQEPVDLDGREVFTSASIGVAVSDHEVEDEEQLMRNADTAMYRAKARGKSRFEVFDRSMHQRAVALLKLETDLRRALGERQFHLVYQPVVTLANQRITSFEALVRWMHPERGLVPPAAFVPLAEETGVIVPLGWWILEEACRQMAEWAHRFPVYRELAVSVNLSHKQIQQPDLIDRIRDTLRAHSLGPERLRLEVNESVLMQDADSHVRVVHRLRELGVDVQVDDFGTGQSSLSYLNRFGVGSVKIDRSFIEKMDVPGERAAVVQAIITLAQDLGIRVIAEGVETMRQSSRLLTLKCDDGQGFLYSQPVDGQAAADLLESHIRMENGRGPEE